MLFHLAGEAVVREVHVSGFVQPGAAAISGPLQHRREDCVHQSK